MVVLAIIGLAAAVAAVGLPSESGAVQRDAERFGARLLAARDYALFSQTETAAVVDAGGYRFEERGAEGWRPLASRAAAPAQWREAVQPAGADLPMRIRFDAVGLAEPVRLRLQSGAAAAVVAVDAAGDVRIEG